MNQIKQHDIVQNFFFLAKDKTKQFLFNMCGLSDKTDIVN